MSAKATQFELAGMAVMVMLAACLAEASAAAPDITVSPTNLSQTLAPNQTATQTLTIGNPGSLPLTWIASPPGIRRLAGGEYHSMALKKDGMISAWGFNNYGGLGDGTQTTRTTPVPVSGLSGVTAIACGLYHSLALKQDGTVWAWGYNSYGQLGVGTTALHTLPVQVSGLSGVSAIACSNETSLALKPDGTVWAWGRNNLGQLGDGTTTARTTPVRITGLTGVSAIAGGDHHSLALKADGTVWAWGYNADGELGDGTQTNRTTPVQVSGLTGVSAIACAGAHSLALKPNGTVWAWGSNYMAQLGDGTRTMRTTPVQVSGLTGVSAIAGGREHSLALKPNGTVWAWGRNTNGELGDGTNLFRYTPVPVSGLTGVSVIACGASHSLADKPDGTVWAWGNNANGQLGEGGNIPWSYTPVLVSGLRSPPPPWLSLAPVSGTAAAGSSSAVTVTFNSAGLTAGTYSATLIVLSNDLETPRIDVPVILVVQGTTPNQAPAIQTNPWANPNPVRLPSTTSVKVVASDPDSGPSALAYTWSLVSGPTGGTVGFAPNGTTGSATSTATFNLPGSYVLRVTISDGAASVSNTVIVLVQAQMKKNSGDFDGDGKVDILLRHPSSGTIQLWLVK